MLELSGCGRGIIRVPGILAGLNERSQSAYAAPAPNPVVSAIGHARPVGKKYMMVGRCSDAENWETNGGRR